MLNSRITRYEQEEKDSPCRRTRGERGPPGQCTPAFPPSTWASSAAGTTEMMDRMKLLALFVVELLDAAILLSEI